MDRISSTAIEAVNYYENRDLYHCMNTLGDLYNITARAGSLALMQTEDKFKVGKAFALFTIMAKVQDKDLLSVAAENAFFCLYKFCTENVGESRAVAAYYIWGILKYAPETLQDKIVETYIANYSSHGICNFRPGYGFINQYDDKATIDNAMQFVTFIKSYFVTLFYNSDNKQLLFQEKGIVMSEVLDSVRLNHIVLPLEKQNVGYVFSQQLFDEIENTLNKDY